MVFLPRNRSGSPFYRKRIRQTGSGVAEVQRLAEFESQRSFRERPKTKNEKGAVQDGIPESAVWTFQRAKNPRHNQKSLVRWVLSVVPAARRVLPRRGNTTQPGVSTPGTDPNRTAP
jgi:hypothetical protein